MGNEHHAERQAQQQSGIGDSAGIDHKTLRQGSAATCRDVLHSIVQRKEDKQDFRGLFILI